MVERKKVLCWPALPDARTNLSTQSFESWRRNECSSSAPFDKLPTRYSVRIRSLLSQRISPYFWFSSSSFQFQSFCGQLPVASPDQEECDRTQQRHERYENKDRCIGKVIDKDSGQQGEQQTTQTSGDSGQPSHAAH